MKKGERETVEKDKKSIKATEKEKIPSLKEKEEGILLNWKKLQFHNSFSGKTGETIYFPLPADHVVLEQILQGESSKPKSVSNGTAKKIIFQF